MNSVHYCLLFSYGTTSKNNQYPSLLCADILTLNEMRAGNLLFPSRIFLRTLFFISDTFISNTRLKLGNYQAKAKQQLEPELLLFVNYLISSFMLPFKANMRYSKKCAKNKCVCFNQIT